MPLLILLAIAVVCLLIGSPIHYLRPHWLTCKHREVHLLPVPYSLQVHLWTGLSWEETILQEYRKSRLHTLMVLEQRRLLSAPIPGLKDVNTG